MAEELGRYTLFKHACPVVRVCYMSVLYDKVTSQTFRPVTSAVFCPAMVSLFLQSKGKHWLVSTM